MLDTLAAKVKHKLLAKQLIQTKKSLTDALMKTSKKTHTDKLYDNMSRSLNVYYSHNVMGKRKYIALRRANRIKGVTNFVQYPVLSNYIRSIYIGAIHDTTELIDDVTELDLDDDISGMIFLFQNTVKSG